MKNILITIALQTVMSIAMGNITDKQSTSCEIIQESSIQVSDANQVAVVNIVEGEDVVFKINDPQFGNIYFEINTNRRFFNYDSNSLHHLHIIAINRDGHRLPVKGSASGFKIAEGLWKLDLSLDIDGKSLELSRRIKVND